MDTHDDNSTGVRTIKASEFKAKCLKLMDEVADSGTEIVITRNGQLVLRLVPYHEKILAGIGAKFAFSTTLLNRLM